MDRAINDGILIPWRKNEPEKPKTALQLLTVDKGGLTYQPAIGEYEDIAEIEFASMYPTLMVTRNISPETVLCSSCKNEAVPEAGYNICEKRRGLIPLALEPLIKRRKIYKQLMKNADEARLAEVESGQVDPRLLIIEQVLSREVEEYEAEMTASRILGPDPGCLPGHSPAINMGQAVC